MELLAAFIVGVLFGYVIRQTKVVKVTEPGRFIPGDEYKIAATLYSARLMTGEDPGDGALWRDCIDQALKVLGRGSVSF
jgi:hypothetical protein